VAQPAPLAEPDVYAIASSSRMRTARARAFVEVLLDEAPNALA
jgi:hypothetical protein